MHRADSAVCSYMMIPGTQTLACSAKRGWHTSALHGPHSQHLCLKDFPHQRAPEAFPSKGSPDVWMWEQQRGFSPTHTERRALGGRVLAAVGAVDPVPLDQLICRRVCPEVISSLHLGVFQCTGPHCGEEHPKHKGTILDPTAVVTSCICRSQIWEHGFGKQAGKASEASVTQ